MNDLFVIPVSFYEPLELVLKPSRILTVLETTKRLCIDQCSFNILAHNDISRFHGMTFAKAHLEDFEVQMLHFIIPL